MGCIVVRGDSWPLLLSPCNTTGAHPQATTRNAESQKIFGSTAEVAGCTTVVEAVTATSATAPYADVRSSVAIAVTLPSVSGAG